MLCDPFKWAIMGKFLNINIFVTFLTPEMKSSLIVTQAHGGAFMWVNRTL